MRVWKADVVCIKGSYTRHNKQCTHECLSHAHATTRRGGEINDRSAFCHCKFANIIHGVMASSGSMNAAPSMKGKASPTSLRTGLALAVKMTLYPSGASKKESTASFAAGVGADDSFELQSGGYVMR